MAVGLVPALIACGLASAAAASETITYTYDAKGRLIKVERTDNSTAKTTTTDYTQDKADNRTNVTVTPPP